MKDLHQPKIIIITGAESTGKSILTKKLSRHFMAPMFPEFSREYVEALSQKYTYDDVLSIAHMQKAQMNKSVSIKSDYIFFDTWLIITAVWFEAVFKKVPDWIFEELKNAPVDGVLLCDTDIPWIPDPVRENGGEMRLKLQQRYQELIFQMNFKYTLISGSYDERFNKAKEFITTL